MSDVVAEAASAADPPRRFCVYAPSLRIILLRSGVRLDYQAASALERAFHAVADVAWTTDRPPFLPPHEVLVEELAELRAAILDLRADVKSGGERKMHVVPAELADVATIGELAQRDWRLWAECAACGHRVSRQGDQLAALNRALTLAEVARRMRCEKCGAKDGAIGALPPRAAAAGKEEEEDDAV